MIIKNTTMQTENTRNEDGLEFPPTGVYELTGEPAVVINGVPEAPPSVNTTLDHINAENDTEADRNTGYGEWLEGREVRKLFGNQYFSGTVTTFDRETGWYGVVYEDGDYEDLEWKDLEAVLSPLDVTVPLKALALQIIRRKEIPRNKTSSSPSRGCKRKKHSRDPNP